MTAVHAFLLALAAIVATAVVLTRQPRDQALVLSFYGLVLTLLFLTLQAPDVAYSELVVGTAAVPLLILITLSKVRKRKP